MFGILIYDIIFFAVPIIAITFFGISLYSYRTAKKANDENPGSYSEKEIKIRKTMLIVSTVVAVILAALAIGFIMLLFMAVAFM